MIQFKTGNIFENTNVDAIVNTVNCVGVMGRGIALQFKKKYPENFKMYQAACKMGEVVPGKMFVFKNPSLIAPYFIINFPTKRHWKYASRMEDIKSGLKDLVYTIKKHEIKSVVIPPLGCGLGGLDWNVVKPQIVSALSQLNNVNTTVYEPAGAPIAEKQVRNKKIPHMTPGRAALIKLMAEYLEGLLDPFISLLEIHKLMYFLQETGEPLRLKYCKAPYGPYAENLRHVLNAIEGYYILGYAEGGDAPRKEISLMPGALEEADAFLENKDTTLCNMRKVTKLVKGFESAFGLELLASILWIVRNENITNFPDIVKTMYNWNARKRQFSEFQVKKAFEVIQSRGWFCLE